MLFRSILSARDPIVERIRTLELVPGSSNFKIDVHRSLGTSLSVINVVGFVDQHVRINFNPRGKSGLIGHDNVKEINRGKRSEREMISSRHFSTIDLRLSLIP